MGDQNTNSWNHDSGWREAVVCFRSGNHSGALFLFKKLAKEGCDPALVEVGNIYETGGGGVKRNLTEAKKWYKKSISVLDDPKAHLALGRIYLQEARSKRDYVSAYNHFILLEECHEKGALFALGYLYEKGLGPKKDISVACKYYLMAAKEGHLVAKRNLAKIKMAQFVFPSCFVWLKACLQLFWVSLRNPNDGRIGVR